MFYNLGFLVLPLEWFREALFFGIIQELALSLLNTKFRMRALFFTFVFLLIAPSFLIAQSNLDSIKQVMYKHTLERQEDALKTLSEMNTDSSFKLRLNNLALAELPDITNFKNITALSISSNHLVKTPKYIFQKDSLKSIDLSSNKLKRIRTAKNNQISSIDLSKNEFKRFPRSIRKLKNLKFLDLSNNPIRRIPCFILGMDSLVELKLNKSQILLNKRNIKRLKNIKQLQLAGNKIAILPESFASLTQLEHLNLADNKINSLPSNFAQLQNLEHLIFYKNNFSHIPNSIFKLKKLKEIDFYYNQIEEIPSAIKQLENLELLFLAFNKIRVLPNSMLDLQKLKALFLHHNQILFLPDWIAQFEHLEILDLGFNKLRNLPDLSKIATLSEVDIQGNNIEEIPMTLLSKKGLKKIFLTGNPFILDSEEVEAFQKLIDELAKKDVRVFF